MKIVKTALVLVFSLSAFSPVLAQEARSRAGPVPAVAPANGSPEQFTADMRRIHGSRAYRVAQTAKNPRGMQAAIAALGLPTVTNPEPQDNMIQACVSAGGTIVWGTIWTTNGYQSGWICILSGSNPFFAHNSTL